MIKIKPQNSVYIKTYGCQMNVYDTNRMRDILIGAGCSFVTNMHHANIVILNTCHIREKAVEKIYSELGRIKKIKEKNPQLIIGVAGCVAQAEGEEIVKRMPIVDLIFGPQTLQELPEMLAEISHNRKIGSKKAVIRTAFSVEKKFSTLKNIRRQPLSKIPTAFVTIQEGCDKFCTFCVVPYTRGAEVSRISSDIIEEIYHLAENGVTEVTLLGQNVNAWYDKNAQIGLSGLLYQIAKIEGIERLRYTTSHPRDMDEALIVAHGEISELMPYLHLPVQAGSNAVLKAMNRQHTVESYLKLIRRIRSVCPDIALSSDFIVGFPSETEEDFEATLSLVKEVNYAQAYSFKYSPRLGTPAADKRQIDDLCKAERLKRLQELLNQQQIEFNKKQKNKILPVLFEKHGKYEGQIIGKSPYQQIVHVETYPSVIGKILPVTIKKTHANSLTGQIL